MQTGLPSVAEFLRLPHPEIESVDILARNYFAASGLPGTENSNLSDWYAKQDLWIPQIQFEIRRHLYRFDPRSNQPPTPYSYGNSLGRFFCWYMAQVLQEDCSVRYHPDRKFKPDFCKPRDVFAHGIMDDDGEGGTCASMPVVYVSVGRKLGLPVYLVETRGHAFFRWDSLTGVLLRWQNPDLALWIPPDRFNVEGFGEGIAFYPDAHYMQWPELWKENRPPPRPVSAVDDAERRTRRLSHRTGRVLLGFGTEARCTEVLSLRPAGRPRRRTVQPVARRPVATVRRMGSPRTRYRRGSPQGRTPTNSRCSGSFTELRMRRMPHSANTRSAAAVPRAWPDLSVSPLPGGSKSC